MNRVEFAGGVRGRHAPLLCLLAAYTLVALVLFQAHSFPLASAETDGVAYMERAESLSLFNPNGVHGPGYSMAIRSLLWIGVDPFSAAKAVSLGFGLVFIAASWFLLSSFSSAQEALLGTFLVACNSVTLIRSVAIMSDMLAAALFLAALAVLIVPEETAPRHFFGAGVLAGLAYLTRYTYILTFAAPLLLWALPGAGKQHRRVPLGRMAAFPLGFLLVTLPWLLFLYQVTGNPLWSKNHLVIAYKMYRTEEGMNLWPALEARYQSLGQVIGENPVLFVKSYLRTALDLPAGLMGLVPVAGPIAAAGCFFWLAGINRRKLVVLGVYLVFGALICLAFLIDRYLLPAVPLVASFVASGVFALPLWITPKDLPPGAARRLQRLPLRGAVLAGVVAFAALNAVVRVPAYFADRAVEYQAAAEWLAPQAKDGVSVLAAKPHAAFFSKTRYISARYDARLQDARLEDLPGILARLQPTYFIYDERVAARDYPHLRALLDPRDNPYPKLLTRVFEINAPTRLVIYRYTGGDDGV